jgi:hypothetical protein
MLFIELKRQKKDNIRETQLQWLEKSLDSGLVKENFAFVEWKL